MNKSIYRYSLRVWLTTLFVSPPIIFLVNYSQNSQSFFKVVLALLLFEGYAIGFGLLLSIPAWLLFYIIFLQADKLVTTTVIKKGVLTFCAIVLLFSTFLVLFKGIEQLRQSENLKYILVYGIVLVLSISYYRLPSKGTLQPTERL